MSRLGDFLSDRWFGLRLWVRYDLSWRVLVVVLLFVPALVGAGVFVGSRPSPGGLAGVSSVPVRLPDEVPAPIEVVPLRGPVTEVLVVGDSLVAGEEGIYGPVLAAAGVSARFDAAVSRGLRYGWLCPSGRRAPVSGEVSAGVPADAPGGAVAVDDEGGLVEGCARQGLEALAWYVAHDLLPSAVVVALGTNDASASSDQVRAQLDAMRELLGRRRVFLLETVTSPVTSSHDGWNDTARAWCFSDAACRFVDWAVAPVPAEFFGADGVHLSASGSEARAGALADALAGR